MQCSNLLSNLRRAIQSEGVSLLDAKWSGDAAVRPPWLPGYQRGRRSEGIFVEVIVGVMGVRISADGTLVIVRMTIHTVLATVIVVLSRGERGHAMRGRRTQCR